MKKTTNRALASQCRTSLLKRTNLKSQSKSQYTNLKKNQVSRKRKSKTISTLVILPRWCQRTNLRPIKTNLKAKTRAKTKLMLRRTRTWRARIRTKTNRWKR